MSRKGITDIIAVVLLLMITISMVGFAWLWFSRMTSDATTKITNQTQNQQQLMGMTVSIENIYKAGNQITVRNTGTYAIPVTQIAVFIDSAPLTCTWVGGITQIAPNTVGVCTSGTSLAACGVIKVSGPSQFDTLSC